MTRVKLTIGYDGTNFHGFARQKGLRTVQGVLEDTLSRILGVPVEVFGSGRTDAGVHARAQVVHWNQSFGPPPSRYPYLLRRALPVDIIPVSAEEVSDDFHARFSVVKKTYRYVIQRSSVPDVFTARYSWHVPHPLDIQAMREVSQYLLGTHDFTSFCAAATPVENKERTLFDVSIQERDSYVDLFYSGSGFLQYMVRILTGTLTDVGLGQLRRSIPDILSAKDRTLAGQTAPAHGLALWNVEYDNNGALDQDT